MKLINKLKKINKLYYTIADLQKITGYKTDSLYVILNRFINQKELMRLASGVYILMERYGEIEKIANLIYFPSYLSFESALSKQGVISQMPYLLNFTTVNKTKKLMLGDYRVEYRKIKEELFWGYKMTDGLMIATPEKALFDMYYIASFGKADFDFQAVDKSRIDMNRVKEMFDKFGVKISLPSEGLSLRPHKG